MAGGKRGVMTRCGGTWTEARYFSFIRSGLRLLWLKYPVRYKVLDLAKRPFQGVDKRTKWEYQCNLCTFWYKGKDIEVDHIKPAGSLNTYNDLPSFVSNLFCELENLQVVCKKCHIQKGAEDRL